MVYNVGDAFHGKEMTIGRLLDLMMAGSSAIIEGVSYTMIKNDQDRWTLINYISCNHCGQVYWGEDVSLTDFIMGFEEKEVRVYGRT